MRATAAVLISRRAAETQGETQKRLVARGGAAEVAAEEDERVHVHPAVEWRRTLQERSHVRGGTDAAEGQVRGEGLRLGREPRADGGRLDGCGERAQLVR